MELVIQTRHTSLGTKDSYGVPITTTEETPLYASVAPRTSTTSVGVSETTITEGLTLYMPSGTSVDTDDLFTVRGVVYIVDGEAFDWASGLGSWRPGTVVDLRKMSNG